MTKISKRGGLVAKQINKRADSARGAGKEMAAELWGAAVMQKAGQS